jgi:hypothetical protein
MRISGYRTNPIGKVAGSDPVIPTDLTLPNSTTDLPKIWKEAGLIQIAHCTRTRTFANANILVRCHVAYSLNLLP